MKLEETEKSFMKKGLYHIVFLFSCLIFQADSIAQGAKEYFNDKDGFFFFIGIDVPKQNVNLVWDEITSKPVKSYMLERSRDGKIFTPVIVQSAVSKPRDVREMSELEQETIQTLNTVVYSTESEGKGRFVFNESITDDLIHKNYVLRNVITNRIKWEDKQLVESLLGRLSEEQPLIYRIKFIYPDGTVDYSGQRSITDYLFFILRRGLAKINTALVGIANPDQPRDGGAKNAPVLPLAACPPINNPPACVIATGNSNVINGTCCNYTEDEFLDEQPGGPPDIPCSQSNSGLGYCTPLILDCPPASSDKCCAGNGCAHYAVCTCKPWECCVYTLPPAWYVVASNNLTPPTASASSSSPPCALGNTTTVNVSGGTANFTYSWTPGGFTTPSLTNVASGSYTVSVADANGCTAEAAVTINPGNPAPAAIFTAGAVCLGQPTVFTNNSTISSGSITGWSWNFGNGNTSTAPTPSETYTASGTYSVTLTVTSSAGCTASVVNIVTVNPQPVANFSVTTVCFGNATQFTDLSTGGATAWTWNFGDGNSSSQESPSNIYTATGTFTVTMNASGTGGCNSNFFQVVTVIPLPVANFSVTTVCPGFPTQFTEQSTGGATQWSWNFGNGNTSTQQNPSTTYAASGSYTATLIATDPGGCNAVISQQVTVFPLPVPDFIFTDICVNTNPAVFTDQSTGAVQWTWNFGDGTPNSTQESPSHVFGAPGTYSVTLVTVSSGGCVDSTTQTIDVNPVPDAIFTSNIVCFNNPTQFTDQSLGAPNQWFWDFGDGNTDTLQHPPHTYGAPGTYTVILIVTNSLGCSDTLPLTAIVNPLPYANFIAPTVCIGNSTCFKDTTLISSGVISTWGWNFDDPASGSGNTSAIQHPCHLFPSVGTYNVFLTVTSNNGCQSTIILPVSVTLPPVASFSVNTVCLNSPTSFTDLSTGAIQWYWNFGDGGTSTLQNPTHVYLGFGSYVVSLIASAGGICTDTIRDTITVSPLPIIAFKSDTVCVGKSTSFTDASFIPAGSITSWIWNFGDFASGVNDTSSLQNPTHIFSSAGTYSITLTVTSAVGCQSSKVFFTLVHPGPQADFSFSPASPINLTDMVIFTDQSVPVSTGMQWWWNFGDGDTSVLQNPEHLYPDISSYTITLITITQNGCTDTITHPIEILQFAFYIPNAFTPGIDGNNDYFFGKGVGIVEYEMHIFDRWGNHIFYCNIKDLPQTPPCMWDGKVEAGVSNECVQQDVYVWKVKLLDIFGETHKYIGTVTVVK
ncbi:MAG: PKD domain-containing protein [Bacteroidetes bacterium]|nr:MAG: PKD domain-containing protein [Bacteroidota bacterium]